MQHGRKASCAACSRQAHLCDAGIKKTVQNSFFDDKCVLTKLCLRLHPTCFESRCYTSSGRIEHVRPATHLRRRAMDLVQSKVGQGQRPSHGSQQNVFWKRSRCRVTSERLGCARLRTSTFAHSGRQEARQWREAAPHPTIVPLCFSTETPATVLSDPTQSSQPSTPRPSVSASTLLATPTWASTSWHKGESPQSTRNDAAHNIIERYLANSSVVEVHVGTKTLHPLLVVCATCCDYCRLCVLGNLDSEAAQASRSRCDPT